MGVCFEGVKVRKWLSLWLSHDLRWKTLVSFVMWLKFLMKEGDQDRKMRALWSSSSKWHYHNFLVLIWPLKGHFLWYSTLLLVKILCYKLLSTYTRKFLANLYVRIVDLSSSFPRISNIWTYTHGSSSCHTSRSKNGTEYKYARKKILATNEVR